MTPKKLLYILELVTKCIKPNLHTILTIMTNLEAIVSTNPSTISLFIYMVKYQNVFHLGTLFIHTLFTTFFWIRDCNVPSCFILFQVLKTLTRLSKYSNSAKITKMVSIDICEISPLWTVLGS